MKTGNLHRIGTVIGAALMLLSAGGCTRSEVYNSAQGMRQQECHKIDDMDKRNHCMETADMPYDEYQRKTSE